MKNPFRRTRPQPLTSEQADRLVILAKSLADRDGMTVQEAVAQLSAALRQPITPGLKLTDDLGGGTVRVQHPESERVPPPPWLVRLVDYPHSILVTADDLGDTQPSLLGIVQAAQKRVQEAPAPEGEGIGPLLDRTPLYGLDAWERPEEVITVTEQTGQLLEAMENYAMPHRFIVGGTTQSGAEDHPTDPEHHDQPPGNRPGGSDDYDQQTPNHPIEPIQENKMTEQTETTDYPADPFDFIAWVDDRHELGMYPETLGKVAADLAVRDSRLPSESIPMSSMTALLEAIGIHPGRAMSQTWEETLDQAQQIRAASVRGGNATEEPDTGQPMIPLEMANEGIRTAVDQVRAEEAQRWVNHVEDLRETIVRERALHDATQARLERLETPLTLASVHQAGKRVLRDDPQA